MNDFDFDVMYTDYVETYNRLAKSRYMDSMHSRDEFEKTVIMAQYNPKYYSQATISRRTAEEQAGPSQRQIDSLLFNLDRVGYKGFEYLLKEKDKEFGLPEGTTTYLTVEDLKNNPNVKELIRKFINAYASKNVIFASIGEYEGIEGSEG